jgi:hypothetical protein
MNKYSIGLALGMGLGSILISYSYFKNCNIYKEKNIKKENNENTNLNKNNSMDTNRIIKIDKVFIKEQDIEDKLKTSNEIVKDILDDIINDVIDKSEEKVSEIDKIKKIIFNEKWTIIN